jgi:metal-responsive CopG/Arc/MetJ family transcriptional regulator
MTLEPLDIPFQIRFDSTTLRELDEIGKTVNISNRSAVIRYLIHKEYMQTTNQTQQAPATADAIG